MFRYKIRFEFKNGKSYTLSYSYDSESQSIKYENVKFAHAKKLKKFFEKQVLDLESALVCAMQQNTVKNLTAENVKASEEQIKVNLVKIDLGEDFLIDIIPDIFKLQNLCKNNLEVEVWECFAPGTLKQMEDNDRKHLNKTDEILEKVKSIRGYNNSKMITFVEKVEKAEFEKGGGMWGGTDNSWIQGYLYGQCGLYGYDDKYKTKYANYKREIIEQKKNQANKNQITEENQDLDNNQNNQVEKDENLDSEELKTGGQISLAGKIARIVFLIVLIAIAILLPAYLGIVGLLFSNVAIPIVVFSVEVILITLIIILILSIRNICRQNNLLKKQINFMPDNQEVKENSVDKNKNRKPNGRGDNIFDKS